MIEVDRTQELAQLAKEADDFANKKFIKIQGPEGASPQWQACRDLHFAKLVEETGSAVPMTQIMVRQIFEQWANDHRANPDDFYTAEEVAAMEVGTLAVKQAIHFMALHRQLQAQPQA